MNQDSRGDSLFNMLCFGIPCKYQRALRFFCHHFSMLNIIMLLQKTDGRVDGQKILEKV